MKNEKIYCHFFCSRVFVISILSMFYDMNKKSSDSEKKLVCCLFICLVGKKVLCESTNTGLEYFLRKYIQLLFTNT